MASQLNAKQKEFVQFGPGPLIAIAGPGTGKTHSLIEKIKFNKDKKILALTFTNKVSAEIKERLGKQEGVSVHTFHSFSLEILQKQDTFEVAPEYEKLLIAQKLKQKYTLPKTPKQILYQISKYKNTLPSRHSDEHQIGPSYDPESESDKILASDSSVLLQVQDDYDAYLQKNNYLDWDDLIDRCIYLEKKYIPEFDLILVDEFQDTNIKQFDLLNHIASNDNIAVIGDPNQSIYSFRGADAQIFNNFRKIFPEYKQVIFETNYRSANLLVSLANNVFPDYKLKCFNKNNGELKLIRTPTKLSEAKYIFHKMNEKVGGTNLLQASVHSSSLADCHFRDFAIIYRKHTDCNLIRKILDEEGIPVQQIGEESPFNNLEAQRFLSELSKLKPNTESLKSYQKAVKIIGFEAPEIYELGQRFSGKPLSELLVYINKISDIGYWDYLGDKVTLCTIHAAKGLEFKYVFIPQFNSQNFPQKNADEGEEKRLFYVAVTRAKEGLFLIQLGKKSKYEQFSQSLADFILDKIGYKALERLKIKKLKEAQASLF